MSSPFLIGMVQFIPTAGDISGNRERILTEYATAIANEDDGRIFTERDVQTATVSMSPAEEQLYERVTEYVREVYNRSDQLNEPAVDFAMALMQKQRLEQLEIRIESRKTELRKREQVISLAPELRRTVLHFQYSLARFSAGGCNTSLGCNSVAQRPSSHVGFNQSNRLLLLLSGDSL